MYFCLDAKVPKNQDLYKNGLGSRPTLRKDQNSLRSNSWSSWSQGRSAATLGTAIFVRVAGDENKEQKNGE